MELGTKTVEDLDDVTTQCDLTPLPVRALSLQDRIAVCSSPVLDDLKAERVLVMQLLRELDTSTRAARAALGHIETEMEKELESLER